MVKYIINIFNMLLLYTFCCDIGRHSKDTLIKVLNILLNSIHKNIVNYKILCFTNFKNELTDKISQKYNIEFREYYDKQVVDIYKDKWLNLSFNKINVYKSLYDEFNSDFCWIDLDTIVCHDISYINNMPCMFIDCGGTDKHPHKLIDENNDPSIPRNKWIQGNLWKLNIDLYNKLMKIYQKFSSENKKFHYDLQGLFTYYFYFVLDGDKKTLLDNNIFIPGRNTKQNALYGLSVWNLKGNTHANIDGLKNLYYDNEILKSKFYPTKDIHILSFTFNTLRQLYNKNEFKIFSM